MTRTRIGFDTETDLIGPGNVIPKLICASFAQVVNGKTESWVIGNGDAGLHEELFAVFGDDSIDIVIHNAAFDLTVICRAFPDLYPLFFQALADGRIFDTEIRETLLNLSTTGDLENARNPDGSTRRILYALGELAKRIDGRDRTSDKKDEDAWRMHFVMLDGLRAADYPAEAYEYAACDAVDALLVFDEQERRIAAGDGQVTTEDLQVAAAFCLMLMTAEGMKIDPAKVAEIEAMLLVELDPAKMPLLYSMGVVRRAEAPRPYANGSKNKDGTPKMTAGEPESVDTKRLREVIVSTCQKNSINVPRTDSGLVATDAEFLETLAPLSPVLAQYVHRAGLQKLVTTELPRMRGGRVHFPFRPIKETGRTSSAAAKDSKKRSLYPSANGQNVHPYCKPAYVAEGPGYAGVEDGWLLCSVDYSSQELVTLAQKCLQLFGHSVLADVLNAGKDPHAYLGSALAYKFDDEFRAYCEELKIDDRARLYDTFGSLKKEACPRSKEWHSSLTPVGSGAISCVGCESAAAAHKLHKHYRTFAKPTGLGYPGGLGPDTFITYAQGTFGVSVTREQASDFRDLWRETYPEMVEYHAWVNSACQDPCNLDAYAYVSPMGMLRRGASFCACANGAGMQTPAAEATKTALFNVVRACFDPTMESCLLGCKPVNYVHDELIVKIPDDQYRHERAYEIGRIMVEAMQQITPDVKVTANPTLMYRWDKSAEPKFDANGRLIPWDVRVAA